MWIDRLYCRVGTNVQDVYDGRDTTRQGGRVRVTRESEYNSNHGDKDREQR